MVCGGDGVCKDGIGLTWVYVVDGHVAGYGQTAVKKNKTLL